MPGRLTSRLLWIVFGCIFIGAAHDFATLIASVRHDARSVGWRGCSATLQTRRMRWSRVWC